jgi:hypothetical protein
MLMVLFLGRFQKPVLWCAQENLAKDKPTKIQTVQINSNESQKHNNIKSSRKSSSGKNSHHTFNQKSGVNARFCRDFGSQ